MKLIAIYGPPGVGKLTVAKELAKITGYKVLHNHLTVDLVGSVFEHGSSIYKKLIRRYRTDLLEEAAKAGIEGVIFTFIYRDDKETNDVLNGTEARLRKLGVKTFFVHLYCDKGTLYKRLVRKSRRKFDKIIDVRALEKTYEGYDLFAPLPFAKSIEIDNTDLSPDKVAAKIARICHSGHAMS